MRRTIVAAAALALLAGSGPTPVAGADQGEDYLLQELRKTNQKWWWPGEEPQIIGIGYDICGDWANGVPYADEVTARLGPPRWWNQSSARFFATLSTRALCPQYFLDKIPPGDQQLIVAPKPTWDHKDN